MNRSVKDLMDNVRPSLFYKVVANREIKKQPQLGKYWAGGYVPPTLPLTIVLDNVPIGNYVLEFSVEGATGFTYSLLSNPGNVFTISSNFLILSGLLTVGSLTIIVEANNGSVTITESITFTVLSVANSWIPGVRPFSQSSPCNTPLGAGHTYTPVPMPASTGFNYFTGVKTYIDVPEPSVQTVCSFLGPNGFGWPQQTINQIMTSGFDGVENILHNGDGDNEAISLAGTTCLSLYDFNRSSDTAATTLVYAETDILTGSGFGSTSGGQFGQPLGAGTYATGCSNMMGILLKEEFTLYGDFNHWIGFSMIASLTLPGFIAPAIAGDGAASGGLIQEGQLLAIPKTTAMPGGLSIYGQALFRAAQNYGWWCFDSSGSITPYCARVYQQGGVHSASPNSWTDADVNLLIADVNIIGPMLQKVS